LFAGRGRDFGWREGCGCDCRIREVAVGVAAGGYHFGDSIERVVEDDRGLNSGRERSYEDDCGRRRELPIYSKCRSVRKTGPIFDLRTGCTVYRVREIR
jgi:hypothetical protein